MRLLTTLILTSLMTMKGLAMGAQTPVDYVSILVGTESKYSLSTGNTYPAVAMPWGMNFWVAQTGKMGDGWQYTYSADQIRGFKQTHQPSPWINVYGQFSLMPTVGQPVFDEDQRASWFSHKAEIATPYYYQTYLADYDIVAELAPTERAAMMQFTFPQTEQANVVVDAFDRGSYAKVIPGERKVVGYTTRNSGGVPDNFKNWFVVVFDKPFETYLTVRDSIFGQSDEMQADHAGAIVTFKTQRGEKVSARVASSFISLEQAEQNLKEIGSDGLEQVKAKGRKCWNEVLGRIDIEDGNIDHLRTFYSCLYRSVLFPRSFYEINAQGEPVHYSPYNGEVRKGYMFTDTGFWDTFRCLFPLLNLVYPSMNVKMQEGLVNAYLESGFLPEWASPGHRGCMVGNNSASIVADAWLKGLRGYDVETLWKAVVHGTQAVHPEVSSTGRLGYEYYNRLGYVPYDVKINENAARTLEYAYDDWCIYQLGKALGKPEEEIGIYAKRAMNYKNLFDPKTKLMRGRLENGKFAEPFNPLKWGDAFTEGNSWHYTWSVFHDPQGLINLMGGKAQFNQMMDSVFSLPPIFDDSYYGFPIHEIREMQIMNMGNYAHGNQPIQHMIYLYGYSGEPWKSQYWIRKVMDRLYTDRPDGYCGDEDNGQTSAWYVFSALGFYPVCPGTNQYVIGTPYFQKATIHLENGRDISIESQGEGCYIQQMMLNGADYQHNYLGHDVLTSGAKINFTLGEEANKQRGTAIDDAPYSFSTATAQTGAPTPVAPLPSASQVSWQQMETYAFIHFGPNTFGDREWGYGDADPQSFNPTRLDTEQWARTIKEAGMKGIILTAKHHDGFCLWPTKYTDYSVRNSPYKDGKGDIVGELAAACRKYGLKMGVYLSPWDRHQAFYGTPHYVEYFHAQLEELLTQYGDLFEVWFDGANGGDGWYGGAKESRKIDRKTYYDFPRAHRLVAKYQPQAVIFSDGGPGCRWVGNENGYADATNWAFLRINDVYPGYDNYYELTSGHADGDTWVASECDVSIRPGWFYHESEDQKVKSVEHLTDLYYRSVGHNGTLLLNFPVDKEGLIHPIDSANAVNFHKQIMAELGNDLLKKASIKASNTRDQKLYGTQNLTDGNYDTYWATEDGVTEATLEITLKGAQKVNRMKLQEYIPLGQRIRKFSVDYFDGRQWQPVRINEATTTIGYKRLLRFQPVTAKKLRIRFEDSRGPICINAVGAYYAPNAQESYEQEEDALVGLDYTIAAKDSRSITLDLGQKRQLHSLHYKPSHLGMVANYEILAGDSPETLRQIASGEFSNIRNNPIRQDVFFAPVDARYVQLKAVRLVNEAEPMSYEKIIVQ